MYPMEHVTRHIIAAAFKVHRTLGPGFLEKVYENSMVIELKRRGLVLKQQCPITVHYEGEVVGEYYADLYVEDKVIVELKASGEINSMHEYQVHNYMRATGVKVGLLFAFGERKVAMRRLDL